MENKINSENKCINKLQISLSMTKKIKIIDYNLKYTKKCFKYKIENSNITEKTSINKLLKIRSYNKTKLYFLFNLLLSFAILYYLSCVNNKENILYKLSEVKLVVNGTGNIKLFSDNFLQTYNAFEIYLNESFLNISKNEFNFDSNSIFSSLNFIKIIWNETIISTKKMFENCYNIIEIDLSQFDTSKVKDMSYMFNNCFSLTSLNLTNFNTSLVETINYIFSQCTSLKSLDLSNFETLKINEMEAMFYNCTSLISLDLSNFNTSQVQNMKSMFYNCKKLENLNLLNFDTSKVTRMGFMFYGCSSLKSLDLSYFKTSIAQRMYAMFQGCSSLISLDLSNFDTSNVNEMSSMFSGCAHLKSLNLSNFDTTKVTNMLKMFYGCTNLISLDLSNFNTQGVKSMSYMFFKCQNLTTLDLSNFNTSKVTSMHAMFYECSSLESLDLSNFDTSNVNETNSMFYRCTSLKYLNLSSFNTSGVKTMASMFSGCQNLISLDLSNFDTSKVTTMSNMFSYCKFNPFNISNFDTSNVKDMSGLFQFSNFSSFDLSDLNTSQVKYMSNMFRNTSYSSLDLSNFDTSNVIDMANMFYKCYSLTSLDLSNFDTSKVINMSSLFYKSPVLNALNISNFNTSNVIYMNNMFSYCSSLTNLNLSNFDTFQVQDMNNMFSRCSSLTSLDLSNFNTSNVEDMKYMFNQCFNLSLLNISNFDTSNVKDMNHMFAYCSLISSLELSNFNIANVDDFSKTFYGCKNLEYINLYISNINPNAKALEMFGSISKNLIVCNDNGNDNDRLIDILPQRKIIQCNNSYNENNYTCYMMNSSLSNKYLSNICKKELQNESIEINSIYINSSLNNNYFERDSLNKFNDNDNDLISYNLESSLRSENYQYSDYYSSEIIFTFLTNTIIQIENNNKTIQNIIDNLIKEFDILEIDNGNDEIIKEQNKTIILTSTRNQKINEDKNNISMNLGECENMLKNDYNISYNNSLFILQIISEEEGMKIPKVEYEIYYPLYNNSNLIKLNLSLCKDTKIEISISVKINGSLDKYNPKSDFYNNICSKTTSESGTDISLKDRRNEFVENNMSLCEENCELIDYDEIKEKAKCSCDIKLSILSNDNTKFDKKDFFKSFADINNIFNINIMKCYKIVLKVKNLIENYGCLIVGSIIILYFISLFIFVGISFDKLKKEIYNIIYILKINANPIKKKEKLKNEINKKKKKKLAEKINWKNKGDKEIKKLYLIKKNKIKLENCPRLTTLNNPNYSNNRKSQKKNFNDIFRKKDFELNCLNYELAILLDHRNYCGYYISLIKYNHPLFFSFGSYNDYNSKIIKIFLFFFSFCLDFVINALFFTDDTMHKIYEDKGEFNFLYQLPQILYSTLISRFIDSFIKNFALTQDIFIDLKQGKVKRRLENLNKKLIQKLKYKFTMFFISTFFILLFLWYYITCFCGIYVNTQIHLIKDTLISLLSSFFIPFILFLLPGIFRISSLSAKKPLHKLLYKFSVFLENWLC